MKAGDKVYRIYHEEWEKGLNAFKVMSATIKAVTPKLVILDGRPGLAFGCRTHFRRETFDYPTTPEGAWDVYIVSVCEEISTLQADLKETQDVLGRARLAYSRYRTRGQE